MNQYKKKTDLHDPGSRKFVIVLILRTVLIFAVLLSAIGASLPLHSLRLQQTITEFLLALDTFRNGTLLDVFHDRVSWDLVLALETSGRGKRAVALHDLIRKNARIGLNVVNVLSIVGQEFILILKQPDKPMSRRELIFGR